MVTIYEILTAYLLGLTASFAPCLFPLLPSFISFLTKSKSHTISIQETMEFSRFQAFLLSLLVTLGVMTVFLGLAFLFKTIIDFFSLNYILFRFLQGVILVLLGGFLTLNVTISYWRFNEAAGSSMTFLEKISSIWIQGYLIGVFFALMAAPCGLVVFGTLFTLLSVELSVVRTIVLIIIFSLGVGTPFYIIAGIIPSLKTIILDSKSSIFRYLPRIAGFIIILTGIYLILDSYSLGLFDDLFLLFFSKAII